MESCYKGYLFLLFLFISHSEALIVPEELASVLSVAYANIPPIKKGTDSRVGFGFSLGNHADVQVLFELGPQRETSPLGVPYATSSKREVDPKASNQKRNTPVTDGSSYLKKWSEEMRLRKKQQQSENNVITKTTTVLPNLQEALKLDGPVELKQPDPPQMPAQVLMRLKELYGEKPKFVPKRKPENSSNEKLNEAKANLERLAQFKINESEKLKHEAEKKRITADLSDVSLDDE